MSQQLLGMQAYIISLPLTEYIEIVRVQNTRLSVYLQSNVVYFMF